MKYVFLSILIIAGCGPQRLDPKTEQQIKEIKAEADVFDRELTETEASLQRLNKTLDEMNKRPTPTPQKDDGF